MRNETRKVNLYLSKAAWRLTLLVYYSFVLIPRTSHAQIGTWQSHVSYRSGQSVAVIGFVVYTATQNGFFTYNTTTGETRTLSKQAGLSDVGISRLLYLPDRNRLLLAYRSGNLDLLTLSPTGELDAVQNVNTIVTATNLPASRQINHINRIGNNAYLSTDFGLVVFDVIRNEIRDTYFSQRPDGSPLPVYQTAATTDSVYALTAPIRASDAGRELRAVRFAANVNIADPGNWRAVGAPGGQTESIAANQGRLLATVNGQGVYERQAGRWVLTQPLTNALIRLFPASGDSTPAGFVLATNQIITSPGSGTFTGPLLTDPREVVVDGTRIWVADAQNGLLAGNAGTFTSIAPDGPTRDQFANLYAYSQTLVALPSGPQDATLLLAGQPPAELLAVPDGRWLKTSAVGTTSGFNSAAYASSEQTLYLGSYGGGLWRQTLRQEPVAVLLPVTTGLFISSLATDAAGNLWIITAGSSAQPARLHVRRPNGTFTSFPGINQPTIAQVVLDDSGFLWLRLDGNGLLVFDPQTNRSRFLSTGPGQGGLPASGVRSLAKDRTGAIWVGTDLGPTVFDNPAGVFDGAVDAQPPLLNRRRLLSNETITSIAVDGGNRKWLGTRNGLYRVAPDGSQLLETFTVDNSPLPSNSIQALAIEPVSGQVFMQTPNGIVSYRGSASEPTETLSGLTIFPNPVRPDFNGTVGITGLTDNATVKILDAGGQLVYETRSQGGTATWDLRDYRGRSAQTGIYLVVVVAADGTEGLAGKLAVVR